MFYRPEEGHGLPHNPFNAVVTPRPIGWISTRGADGDNIAPYSFFNAVAYVPPQVMFSSTSAKDSLANIRETNAFCVNVVSEALMTQMNESSAAVPRGVDEFTHAGIAKAECTTINAPRAAHAPAALECKLTQILQLPGDANFAIFGEVTGIHLSDDCLHDGIFDVLSFNPVSRLGYRDFATVRDVFSLKRPGE